MPAPNRLPQREISRLPPRQKRYSAANLFDYDESKKPDDMEYQWVALTVLGQETRNQTVALMNGWTPVPAQRHPELAGPRTQNDHIVVGGQMLMQIPKQYYDEDQDLNNFEARNVVEQNVARLGLAAKRDGVRTPFKRTMEPVVDEVE